MPAERYYLAQSLQKGCDVSITDQEYHHLVHVMRAAVGDTVELVNGTGDLATATVARLDKRQALLTIQDTAHEAPQLHAMILAQALPRINRMDFIVEKGTELGMTQLWLFPGEHSERKSLTDHQVDRLRAMAIAAMKQCGRLYLPEIIVKPAIKAWQPLPYPLFYGDVAPNAPRLAEAWPKETVDGAIFCIGPESGFTPAEEHALKALNAIGVSLHRNILRTDTASLVALTQLYQQL